MNYGTCTQYRKSSKESVGHDFDGRRAHNGEDKHINNMWNTQGASGGNRLKRNAARCPVLVIEHQTLSA